MVAYKGQASPAGEAGRGWGEGRGAGAVHSFLQPGGHQRPEGLMSLAQDRQWEAFFPFFNLGFLTLAGVLL